MRFAAPPEAHTQLIERLRRELRATFEDAIGTSGSAVALLDFPMHENVGDAAIWAGELALLEEIGVPVAYACDAYGYRRERVARTLGPEDPILLHGGGNFGDVWEGFQAFRERVIADFPDRRIVQLPQTLHYRTETGLDRTRAVLRAHGGVTVLVRDEPSLRLAKDALAATATECTDAAFALRAPETPRPGTAIVWLKRRDREQADAGASEPGAGSVEPVDWPDHWAFRLLRTVGRVHKRSTSRMPGLADPADRAVARLYSDVASRRVDLGFRMIGAGEVLVSDRLHAHILACLLGTPSVVVDNSYGKLSSFVARWTAGSPLVRHAPSHAEGLALAAALRPPVA